MTVTARWFRVSANSLIVFFFLFLFFFCIGFLYINTYSWNCFTLLYFCREHFHSMLVLSSFDKQKCRGNKIFFFFILYAHIQWMTPSYANIFSLSMWISLYDYCISIKNIGLERNKMIATLWRIIAKRASQVKTQRNHSKTENDLQRIINTPETWTFYPFLWLTLIQYQWHTAVKPTLGKNTKKWTASTKQIRL